MVRLELFSRASPTRNETQRVKGWVSIRVSGILGVRFWTYMVGKKREIGMTGFSGTFIFFCFDAYMLLNLKMGFLLFLKCGRVGMRRRHKCHVMLFSISTWEQLANFHTCFIVCYFPFKYYTYFNFTRGRRSNMGGKWNYVLSFFLGNWIRKNLNL